MCHLAENTLQQEAEHFGVVGEGSWEIFIEAFRELSLGVRAEIDIIVGYTYSTDTGGNWSNIVKQWIVRLKIRKYLRFKEISSKTYLLENTVWESQLRRKILRHWLGGTSVL